MSANFSLQLFKAKVPETLKGSWYYNFYVLLGCEIKLITLVRWSRVLVSTGMATKISKDHSLFPIPVRNFTREKLTDTIGFLFKNVCRLLVSIAT